MRILFLTHSFNSLTQRLFVALREQGHEVSVEFDINDAVSIEAVDLHSPDLIIAPFLKRAIPAAIWRQHVCLVVHPGVVGDRGPSALDWAILRGEEQWGVTVLQANAVMDGGDVWAHAEFPMREASKASLYRSEVADAAVAAVTTAVERFGSGEFRPTPLADMPNPLPGCERPLLRQQDRRIDWAADSTATVLRKIRSADGFPGLADEVFGRRLYLFDARPASGLSGTPGELLARAGGAVAVATRDGAVWLGQLRDPDSDHPFKLPAIRVLGALAEQLPELPADHPDREPEIRYTEHGQVGFLEFEFYNGAMGTARCEALLEAYQEACRQDTRVIVLTGGPDFWSNGMDLNEIESADSTADESWRNINAIDDLAEAIIGTTTHLTVAALRGNAGAGGVFLARAADYVWSHSGITLNPHYKDMGNLYGSEFWSYLLPRCCGDAHAREILEARLPVGARQAAELGLIDEVIGNDRQAFEATLGERARAIAESADYPARLEAKATRRAADEREKPLADYREAELERMRMNFYGFDPSYHVARYNFVYKVPKSRTPTTIARHRRRNEPSMRDAS